MKLKLVRNWHEGHVTDVYLVDNNTKKKVKNVVVKSLSTNGKTGDGNKYILTIEAFPSEFKIKEKN